MTPPRKQPKSRPSVHGNTKLSRRMFTYQPVTRDTLMCVMTVNSSQKSPHPHAVIPTDAASVEEMVERAAKAINAQRYPNVPTYEQDSGIDKEGKATARAVVRDLLGLKGRK